MGSKARLRFLNRAARFDADIEFIDVVGLAVARGDLTPFGGSPLFDCVDATAHPRLAKQKPSDESRREIVGHLRNTVYASYVKDLYEDFSAYLMDMVLVARKGFTPAQLAGSHKVTLDASDVLDCGTWDGVVALVTESLFERLGNMSNTKRIIQSFNDFLGLSLDPSIVDAAQPFVEIRHLLVHADGQASDAFCAEFPGFGVHVGQTVKLSGSTVSSARAAITALVEHIDAKAIDAGLVTPEDMQ